MSEIMHADTLEEFVKKLKLPIGIELKAIENVYKEEPIYSLSFRFCNNIGIMLQKDLPINKSFLEGNGSACIIGLQEMLDVTYEDMQEGIFNFDGCGCATFLERDQPVIIPCSCFRLQWKVRGWNIKEIKE